MPSFTFMTRKAQVLVGDQPVASVTIETATASGAVLVADNAFALPNLFTVEAKHRRRACRVMWRNPPKVGVLYEEA
ncbi:MAG: hypothetical protein K2X71_08530 [Methylobacterium sp.]|uniref:hypothetical protein n=1 Tax=Methylobacterium sp. TaxID=409 RepID=UPI0025832141|nr:hypothetical protein [Methylobacterium sp.]MBY0296070.1 hypothetical protein [Methylobacterium sp.]